MYCGCSTLRLLALVNQNSYLLSNCLLLNYVCIYVRVKFRKDKKIKIGIINVFRKKYIYSEEAILNLKKNSKSIILYNKDYTVYGEYSSITEAANSIRCNVKTITRALNSKSKLLLRRFFVKFK